MFYNYANGLSLQQDATLTFALVNLKLNVSVGGKRELNEIAMGQPLRHCNVNHRLNAASSGMLVHKGERFCNYCFSL